MKIATACTKPRNDGLFLAIGFFGCANFDGGHGADELGGAPAMLDRRWATPFIGGAVYNCLIGCAESSSTPNYSQRVQKEPIHSKNKKLNNRAIFVLNKVARAQHTMRM